MCFEMTASVGKAKELDSKIPAVVTTSVQDDRVPQQEPRSGSLAVVEMKSAQFLWSQLGSSCAAECYTLLSIST